MRVNAVAYFRVIDPNKAVTEVENFLLATSQIAQTTLRSVLGKAELDALLSERERLNVELQQIIDEQTEPWGIKVTTVEVKDVELPADMQRAMARQAEAERERRAKIIAADGEFQAAEKLSQAANIISENPATLQLRYLQTLLEIGVNKNSTIVFPLPIDLFKPLIEPHAQPSVPTAGDAAEAASNADLARGPHRPAHRPAGDPRPGPGRAPRRLRPAAGRAAPRRRRAVPVLRGTRGPHPARGLGGPPRRRRARHAGLDARARSPTSTPCCLERRAASGGRRRCARWNRAHELGRSRSAPPIAAPSPTCSRRSRRPGPTR